ncbi:hypothetical protein ASPSYDRAFT_36673 [Aspergillus sydowii CBS 593.65]|uniref:RlpA-like protein double-psi beta-barrel domain-containing protein n=1 Tax=Aspergillus sydowii CBS 593.65 TaxID=1036612 RepID=A0A1L9T139_9EURO|nr:uncharacterized protein ASPSYDRAFT_36673 [Aspergillus sydowii CBS 593.65]OJJ53119.1 hypothetical protein ASPSYDRAFT_36673 [Aspergillus sydowii CBS 593.65]
MAPLAKSLAVAATAFAALGAAAPGHAHMHNHKRDEVTVWNTVTTVVWKTIDVTTTVTNGQSVPTTRIEQTVNEATAPAPKLKEAISTSTSTSTRTSTSTAQLTSSTTEAAAPSVETTVQVPTVPIPTQEPEPEPTQEPEPEPTTTQQPPVETSTVEPQPEPTQSSGGGGGSSGGPCSSSSPCTGEVTFYDVATSRSAPSSCGNVNNGSTDKVLALPVGIMQDSDCGKTVTIKYKGKTSTATVVDKCMGCDNTSIDLSRASFLDFASESEGRLYGVEWFME